MTRPLTKPERARRQRAMIHLRSWMENNGIPRQEIADQFGITRGHLSTLVNANRTATQEQVNLALALVESGSIPPRGVSMREHKRATKRPKKTPKETPDPRPEKSRQPNKLRPMTPFETQFVTDVAKAWIDANPGVSKEELVEVVRALSIGIRS